VAVLQLSYQSITILNQLSSLLLHAAAIILP